MARKMGMSSAEEFLHSRYNPKIGNYVRAGQLEIRGDGAGALVLCASDIAHRFHDHPIEILENGTSCLEKFATERAYQQVKHPVKYAMLRGFGGGQNVTCTILKSND